MEFNVNGFMNEEFSIIVDPKDYSTCINMLKECIYINDVIFEDFNFNQYYNEEINVDLFEERDPYNCIY